MKTKNLFLAVSLINLLIIASVSENIRAQENYYLKNFTSESGLPHNAVKCITKDQTGFLWIATWDGLSRFDGYEFRNYFHNPNDSISLPYFSIIKVVTDKNNNLWVLASESEVAVYNRFNDAFHRVIVDPKIYPTDMTTDPEGNIWLLGREGMARFDPEANRFVNIEMIDKQHGKIHFSDLLPGYLTFDNKKNVWLFFFRDGFIHIFRSVSIEKSRVLLSKKGQFPNGTNFITRIFNFIYNFSVFESPAGNQWIFSNFGFMAKANKQGELQKYKGNIPESELRSFPSYSYGTTGPKIVFYDAPGKQSKNFSLKSDESLICSYIDRSSSFWYSTIQGSGEGTGLTHVIESPYFFRHYFMDQNKNGILNPIFAVLKTRSGEIWAAPRNINSLFRLKPNGVFTSCNQLDETTWNTVKHPRAFLEDSTGIWIGYFRSILNHYDPSGNKFSVRIFNKSDNQFTDTPIAFRGFERNGKDIVINGDGAIYNYSPVQNKTVLKWRETALHSPVYCLKKDKKGNFWIGLLNSTVKCLDPNFREIASYRLCSGRYNVEDICFGDNNDLFAALLGSGIARLDLATGKTEILTTADGLSNNTTYSILKDNSGNIWISTDHGISRYNPKTGKFRIFGQSDGLKIDEFDADAAFLAPDGEMLFGGMGGVVGFYPDSLKEESVSISTNPIVFTDFRVSGIPRLFSKAIYEMDTVSLLKGEDNFQLNFACIDFKNSDKIKYRYKLSGEDKTFTETDHERRFVNYANLAPGNYQLLVEATNTNGEWCSSGKLLVKITPHYYQTIWFKLLIIFIVLSVTATFILMQIRQIYLKASRKQAELRLESLRGQMNPHFIFNSLNSINYFISQNDRLSANRYIADFSRLIRSFLANLSKDWVPFLNELETIEDYLQLEHLRFGNKFDYSLTLAEGFEPESKMIFPGMVQPFIENAIWHGIRGPVGRIGNVTVRFIEGSADYCICIVEDDGIGRKLAEERKSKVPGRKSNGIAIVLERLKIINQIKQKNLRLVIEDLYPEREETGTRVTIEIPVQPIKYDT